MAEITHQIALFTQAILSMERYLLGVIEVNPKNLLEKGIRQELIKLIAKYLNSNFVFSGPSVSDFTAKLQYVGKMVLL